MKNIKTQNKLIIFSIILLGVISFDVFWFLHINNSAADVLELKKIVNQEMSQNNNITALKKDIDLLKESQGKLDDILISRDGVVIFIEALENIASKTNTTLQIQNVDIEVIKEGEKELYGELNMILNISGSWAGVTRYLNFVETLPYRVMIESLKLSTSTKEDEVGWSMGLSITGITH